MKKNFVFMILMVMCCLNLTADLTEGLIGYYPFNGNANDESGNGNNGTVNGAILVADKFGNENSAFEFDGINDYIQTNPADINREFSIIGWIDVSDTDSSYLLYSAKTYFGNSLSDQWRTRVKIMINENNQLNCKIRYNSGALNDYDDVYYTSNEIVGEGFHQIGLVRNYNTIQLIIDEQIVSHTRYVHVERDQESYDLKPSYFNIAGFCRDWDSNATTHYYSGVLDDIRIYNRVLSESEIQELYHEGGWALSANFTSPETAYIGEAVKFIDTSFGNPTTWKWDFENDGIYDLTYNSFQDTIYWTYVNTEIDSVKLKISSGTVVDSLTKAISVLYCSPAPPDSVLLTLNYPDVTISWTAVDTTICGSSITPDLYIIQYSETAEDSLFYYLSSVLNPITEFTHIRVLQYGNNGEPSEHMFYKVIAIKDYNRKQIEYLESLNTSRKKVKWNEVKQKLKEKRGINFEN